MTDPTPTIAAFADVHFADADAGVTQEFRAALPRLRQCVAACNRLAPELVVQLGDLVDHDADHLAAPLAVLEELEPPILHVLGNHDFHANEEAAIQAVLSSRGLERRFYDRCLHNWRIIVLDGTDLSTFGNPPGTSNHRLAEELCRELESHNLTHAQAWNGGIGVGQLAWLRSRLAESTRLGQSVAIFCHFPAYPASRYRLLNADELLEMIAGFSCVRLFANGHAHAWSDTVHQGIRFVTVPALIDNEPPGPLTLFRLTGACVAIEHPAVG